MFLVDIVPTWFLNFMLDGFSARSASWTLFDMVDPCFNGYSVPAAMISASVAHVFLD